MPSQVIDQQLAELSTNLPQDLGIHDVSVEDVRINALVYADPGVGKTTFAESANRHPATAPVLFFNIEGGLLSVARRRPAAIDIQSVDHLETLLHMYAQGDPRLRRYRTLAMDSASELQRTSLQSHIVGRQRGNRGRDLNDINRDDYGRMTVQLQRVLSMMRDLPAHTIITAHPRKLDDDAGTPTNVFPGFTPRLATSIMGFYDFVWYMYMTVEEQAEGPAVERRWLLTRDRGIYKAKTRGPRFRTRLGERFELGNDQPPMLPEIYQMLLETEAEGPDEETATGGLVRTPYIVGQAGPERIPSVPGAQPVRMSLNFDPPSEPLYPRRPSGTGQITQNGETFRIVAADTESDEEADMYETPTPEAAPVTPEAPPAPESQGTAPRPPVGSGTRPVTPRMSVRAPARQPTPTTRAMQQARERAAQNPRIPASE